MDDERSVSDCMRETYRAKPKRVNLTRAAGNATRRSRGHGTAIIVGLQRILKLHSRPAF
jgi:hypothetical protein